MTNLLAAVIWMVCFNNNLPVNQNVVDLLLETCAVESDFGKYDKQLNGGPARGIFQMEPNTAEDIIINYVEYRPELYDITDPWLDKGPMSRTLLDSRFAVIMARIHYLRVDASVPSTRLERAKYWKNHYNTRLGKGTVDKYLEKAQHYLGDEE